MRRLCTVWILIICMGTLLPTLAGALQVDVWLNNGDGSGLYRRGSDYLFGDEVDVYFTVDEPCTARLIIHTPVSPRPFTWQVNAVPGQYYKYNARVGGEEGEREVLLEAWTDSEFTRDVLYFNGVSTFNPPLVVDVWTDLCGFGPYDPGELPRYYNFDMPPDDSECLYAPGDGLVIIYAANKTATVTLTIYPPQGEPVVYGPTMIPPGTRIEPFVAGSTEGLRRVLFEATAGSEQASDQVYINISNQNQSHWPMLTGIISDAQTSEPLAQSLFWTDNEKFNYPFDQPGTNGIYFLRHPWGWFTLFADADTYIKSSVSKYLDSQGLVETNFALVQQQRPSKAINLNPGDGATGRSINTDISWNNGGGATSYDVYFGTDPTPGGSEFLGNQTALTLNPGTLDYDTTYYWRIDSKNDAGMTQGDIWRFTTESFPQPPSKAINLNPGDGATSRSINTDISWTNGGGATSYDVYFGTDPTPDGGEFELNQTIISFDCGMLEYNTTYYWRVDAKNANGTTTGDVWRFNTISHGHAQGNSILPSIILLLLMEESFENQGLKIENYRSEDGMLPDVF